LGGCVGLRGPGGSIMVAPNQSVSPGLNAGGQVGAGVGAQAGWSFRDKDYWWEYGVSTPGASATIYYVWE
jgi:hypothetical protein